MSSFLFYMIGARKKNISIYSFLTLHGHLTFGRWLPPILLERWLSLVDEVYSFNFDNSNDVVNWKWNKNGQFTTKPVYNFLSSDDNGQSFKHIWKAKMPYKIKIFLWLLENGAVLTKDNMIKKNGWEIQLATSIPGGIY